MRLFNIFKSPKPVIVDDALFGPLRFKKVKNRPHKSYLKGKGMFKPTGREIEYFICGNETGPQPEQKEFYQAVQRDFGLITKNIKPLIEDEFRNWQDDFTIRDFNKEFILIAMSIPRQENKPLEWHLSFETIHDSNHQVTVEMNSYVPMGIVFDG